MEKSYTESPHYQINITARYMKLLGMQWFEESKQELSFDDFIVLSIVAKEGPMCQRDLAKLIIKDRASTGRLANSLKNKGFMDIVVDKKNNRLVNKLSVTQKGLKYVEEVIQKFEPILNKIEEDFTEEDVKNLTIILEKYRNVLEKIVNTQI